MKKKILSVVIILSIILLAGGAVFFGNKLLTTRNQSISPAAPESKPAAYTGTLSPATDSCKRVKIEVVESPNCPQLSKTGSQTCPVSVGAKNNVTSYQTTYKITSNDGQTHTITYRTSNNFCNSACGTYYDKFGGIYSCSETPINSEAITQSVPYDIVISRDSPTGQACGTYQQDIWIDSVDGSTSCNFKTADGNVGAWGMCQTGVNCPGPTASPTPTSVATPIAGDHCDPLEWTLGTPTPTPTPTASPKSCNLSCSADTDCAGDLICSGGMCRNEDCTGETDCTCPVPTPKSCNLSCDTNADCQSGLFCGDDDMCRNPGCPAETDCVCPGNTPTPTPRACSLSCDENADCAAGLTCNGNMCRNPWCLNETDCVCPTNTATPRPTSTPLGPSLPNAGVGAPAIMGIGGGLLLVVTALLLAL